MSGHSPKNTASLPRARAHSAPIDIPGSQTEQAALAPSSRRVPVPIEINLNHHLDISSGERVKLNDFVEQRVEPFRLLLRHNNLGQRDLVSFAHLFEDLTPFASTVDLACNDLDRLGSVQQVAEVLLKSVATLPLIASTRYMFSMRTPFSEKLTRYLLVKDMAASLTNSSSAKEARLQQQLERLLSTQPDKAQKVALAVKSINEAPGKTVAAELANLASPLNQALKIRRHPFWDNLRGRQPDDVESYKAVHGVPSA